MKHPKSVPSCSMHGFCTHSKPLSVSSTHSSSHVNTWEELLGRASSVCWGPASTLHSTSNFLSNL